MDNFPLGAKYDSRAPWYEEDNPVEEIEVIVSLTLSKTVKVKVTDYVIEEGEDEDGPYCYKDFSETNLLGAVEEQVILPQDASLYVDVGEHLKAADDLSGWHVDEFICEKV